MSFLKHNLESTDGISAVPEWVTKRKLFLVSVWKQECCNILDVNSNWTSTDFIPFHRPKLSSSSSRFIAPSLEICDATCIFNPGIIFSEIEAREWPYVLIMERLFSDHGFPQVSKALKRTEYLQYTKYLLYTMIQNDSWRFHHQQSSTFQINMSSCPQKYVNYREQRPIGSNFINNHVEGLQHFLVKRWTQQKKMTASLLTRI